jgi:predicted GIY-YIG superfamily endonuclease
MPYFVYVIELDKTVANIQRFIDENPEYVYGMSCFYVGQTSTSPQERFDQHLSGYKANRYAKKFGLKLRPGLFRKYNPIGTRENAEYIEQELATSLRSKGYGVWCR